MAPRIVTFLLAAVAALGAVTASAAVHEVEQAATGDRAGQGVPDCRKEPCGPIIW